MAYKDFREALELFESDYDADRSNRDDAFSDLKFRAGDQWDANVRKLREAQQRPVLTVNCTGQFIRQISGDWRKTAASIDVIAGDDAEPETAELVDGLIRQIQYESGAQYVYSWSVECAASCGIGHHRVTTKYDGDSFDQKACVERINDPLSVTWPSDATKLDRSDAKHCFVSDLISQNEFKRRYPNEGIPASFNEDARQSTLYWADTDLVRIASFYYLEEESIALGLTQDGRVIDITGVPREWVSQMGIVNSRKGSKNRVMHRLMAGNDWLSDAERLPGRYIPIVPVLGEEVPLNGRIVRHGIIRWMKDPQRLYNLYQSAGAELIGLQPKAPFMVTPDMIKGHEAHWNTLNLANKPYLPFNPDKAAPQMKPERQAPPAMPAAFFEASRVSGEDMFKTTGIYPAALGAKSNETSGRAIEARQRESDTTTFTYFDNANAAIKRTGEILVSVIQEIYDGERTVRILDKENKEGIARINAVSMDRDGPVIVNDITSGKYDVRIKTGPNYATAREQARDRLNALIDANPNIFPLVADKVFEDMNMPELAERFKRLLPPQAQGEQAQMPEPDPMMQAQMEMQMQQGQLQLQGAAADVEKKQAEAEGKQLDNAMKEQQLRMGPIEMQFNQRLQEQKLQMTAEQARANLKARSQQAKAKSKAA